MSRVPESNVDSLQILGRLIDDFVFALPLATFALNEEFSVFGELIIVHFVDV